MSERVCVIGAGSPADGTFSEFGLGAADVPEEASGTWRLDRDSIVLSEAAPGGCRACCRSRVPTSSVW